MDQHSLPGHTSITAIVYDGVFFAFLAGSGERASSYFMQDRRLSPLPQGVSESGSKWRARPGLPTTLTDTPIGSSIRARKQCWRPASALYFVGNGNNIIYMEWENDIVAVVRWISGSSASTTWSDQPIGSAAYIKAAELSYLIAMGFAGDPTARVMGNGGAQKKNSYTPSCAQSSARSLT